jgi:hypothetical protein
MSAEQPDMSDVERILADPKGRYYKDLRDRAAYVFITGSFPTHLRVFSTRVLVAISRVEKRSATASGLAGSLAVDPDIAMRLGLAEHPMAQKVLEHIREGYQIRVSRGPNVRKPYYKIWLFKGEDRRTIKVDGSMLQGWA